MGLDRLPERMAARIDEPIEVTAYDAHWPDWYAEDAAELRTALAGRLRSVEHFGSTAVVGLAAKPIVDILVAPIEWPLSAGDRRALESLGYEYLGEAGVPGREYLRRRRPHATNLAVVEGDSALWRDNLAVRDYLRSHPEAAAAYALAKQRVWAGGARTLLHYSEAKGGHVAPLLAAAKAWQAGR
jgi:GrpB-like predicted nucleotidyltransferase (UPF0157 family)